MKRLPKLLPFAALAVLSVGTAIMLPTAPAAAIPVFDASNYAQNILQAARALEQVNNQIRSLQNEAAMLQNMARDLERIDFPQLQQMTSALQRIDRLMGQAQAIDFEVSSLDRQFRTLFPTGAGTALKTDERVAEAKARMDAAMDGFRKSMIVQAQVVSNIRDDAALINELVGRSQGAVGGLQAQQATNQLLALSTKQQFQLQELMAAEFRSQGLERARRARAEAEARAATRRFLGSGKAYTRMRD
jgi:P-type conjugative transfer protein TrbJ